jgi:pentapeptide MXKDX repeat protein
LSNFAFGDPLEMTMKKAVLVATCIAALSLTTSVFAQNTTGPAPQSDNINKGGMSKDGMMKKDSMSKDSMSKDSMSKDSMSKDGMKKDDMKK